MAETLFRILPRTPEGALSEFSKAQLQAANIKVSFERAVPPSFEDRVATVLTAFRQVLPPSIKWSEDSPFLILSTEERASAEPVHPMECQCECGGSNTCSGGGHGSKN